MIGGHEIAGSEAAGEFQDLKTPVVGNADQQLEAYGLKPITLPVLGKADQELEAYGAHIVMVAFCGVARQETHAYGFTPVVSGTATPGLGKALQELHVHGMVANYKVDGVPQISVSRTGTDITVNVSNVDNTPVSIWKADSHRANYIFVNNYQPGEFPVIITGSGNTKIKAAFAVIADRGGAETRTEGRRSPSQYTIE